MQAKIVRWAAAGLVFGLLMAGCVTNLAPIASPKVLDESKASLEMGLIMLSQMDGGRQFGTYEERDASYSQLLGKLETVSVLIEARLPPSDITEEKVRKVLDNLGIAIPADIDLTTAIEKANLPSLDAAIDAITKLRTYDKYCSKHTISESGRLTPPKEPLIWNSDEITLLFGANQHCPNSTHVKSNKKAFVTNMTNVIFYENLLIDLKGAE